jgi:hypothetical protein
MGNIIYCINIMLKEELERVKDVYEIIIEHLDNHLKQKYDETDSYQSKMLKKELRRIKKIIRSL